MEKVFVVNDDIDWPRRAFVVVAPGLESFKDHEQFFVMDIIIQPWGVEGLRVKGNWIDGIFYWGDSRQNSSKHIVQGIGFDNQRGLGDLVGEDQGSSKGFLKGFKGGPTYFNKNPQSIFLG